MVAGIFVVLSANSPDAPAGPVHFRAGRGEVRDMDPVGCWRWRHASDYFAESDLLKRAGDSEFSPES